MRDLVITCTRRTLSSITLGLPKGPSSASSSSSGGAVPVPVPVYCRPLAESQQGMKIWCAAGVNLMGGHTRDGGLMVGGSVFYYDDPVASPTGTENINISEVDSLDRELIAGKGLFICGYIIL